MTLTVEEKSMWVRKRSQHFQKMQTAPPLTPKIGGMTGGCAGAWGWQTVAGSESEGQTEGPGRDSGHYKDPAPSYPVCSSWESQGGQDGMIFVWQVWKQGCWRTRLLAQLVWPSQGHCDGRSLCKDPAWETHWAASLPLVGMHTHALPAAQGLLVGSTLAFLDAS